ncbi:MAG: hypothetical protein MZU97_23960 [Bacillus subtilis]|nr:hypothetical protein [Bacillus subtilis]
MNVYRPKLSLDFLQHEGSRSTNLTQELISTAASTATRSTATCPKRPVSTS